MYKIINNKLTTTQETNTSQEVDAFYTDKDGKEIAIKAIQRYFQNTKYKPDPKKLGAYAKTLRVNITPYILSYTT